MSLFMSLFPRSIRVSAIAFAASVPLYGTASAQTSTQAVGAPGRDQVAVGAGAAANAVAIGLDADLSSASARSGEAIRRGIELAIDEINASGGVLGRPLRLVARDHRGNPARGIDNIVALANTENLVAVVGGIHTPVALAELDTIHARKVIYLGAWAAGTPVVANGRDPNYVFRVSVRDEYAGEFLLKKAQDAGYERPGLLLENTGWGRSNEKAFKAAARSLGVSLAGIAWFNWGVTDLAREIDDLRDAGADVVMLVANPREGVVAMRSMAGLPAASRLPIISHWGITGGNFHEQVREHLATVDLSFLQTYSFIDPPFPARSAALFRAYRARYPGIESPADVISPVGTAHAYDLIHLLALAIEKAGTIDRVAVRAALEQLGPHDGLVRRYDPPFSANDHDALDASDFRLARFDAAGAIVPIVER